MEEKNSFWEYLKEIEEESLQKLKDIVSINSYTRNREGVNAVGELCIDFFRPLGFEVKVIPSTHPECGDHIFLTRPGKVEDNFICVSHLDTVYLPEEEKHHDFLWREESGTIYGPGVSDIKGGTIVIYMMMKALFTQKRDFFEHFTWKIMLNAIEEEGFGDFPKLARGFANKKTLACLVYELGNPLEKGSDFVTSRKGALRFRLETVGRQAHSGTHHQQGANAVWELAEKISLIQNLTDYERGVTFNVGKISGGIVPNRVPDHAYCEIDVRIKDEDTYKWAVNQLLTLNGPGEIENADKSYRCQVKVTQLVNYPPWPHNDKSEKLAEVVLQCAQELGLELVPVWRKGASDACHLWDLVPTVDGLGPIGRNCHCSIHSPEEGKEQESVEAKSFIERTLLNIAIVLRLGNFS